MIGEAKAAIDRWRATRAKDLKAQRVHDRLEREAHQALIG
jgi:hypothetical protein